MKSEATRRELIGRGLGMILAPRWLAPLAGCGLLGPSEQTDWSEEEPAARSVSSDSGRRASVHYLEFVRRDVDAFCRGYTSVHGVAFSEPDAVLGGARTVRADGGYTVGVRSPKRDEEAGVTRFHIRVDDIDTELDRLAEAGVQILRPPTELSGRGIWATLSHGGDEFGLWQV